MKLFLLPRPMSNAGEVFAFMIYASRCFFCCGDRLKSLSSSAMAHPEGAPAFLAPGHFRPLGKPTGAPAAAASAKAAPSANHAGTRSMFLLGAGAAASAACRRAGRAARAAGSASRALKGGTGRLAQARQSSTALRAQEATGKERVAMQATATVEAPSRTYEVGDKVHGWTCVREEYVKEFSCTGYLFQHDKTGAELLSMVQPADENKTFSVVFRTPPENSNGIAHVSLPDLTCPFQTFLFCLLVFRFHLKEKESFTFCRPKTVPRRLGRQLRFWSTRCCAAAGSIR